MERRLVSQTTIAVNVNDASGVAGARRRAQQIAESLQMSATAAGKAALVATELATNLIKHADHGTIFFLTSEDQPWTLTILSTDKGRGISNVPGAMRDGYSTAGSPGTGLGAISRNASVFDIWSAEGKGTIALCRVEDEALRKRVSALDRAPRVVVAGVCLPLAGEDVAGDAWTSMHDGSDQTTIVVVDGLGHGPAAATAANAAVVSSRSRAG
ncbi:MAG: ATP-binding protein, partial [Acidobacteria bacterium]|nr:ATP-binding protein [Acidobacteriota bacterium]